MAPQLGRGRLLADARGSQPGLDQEGEAQGERDLNDDRRGHVGNDVTADEAVRRGAEGAGRFDVVLLAHGDDLAPEHPHEARDEDDGDGDGGVVDAGAEQGGDGQGQDQRGEREHGVHRPHDHASPPRPGRSRRSTRGVRRTEWRCRRSRRWPAWRCVRPRSPAQMSRPRSSVPSQCAAEGPALMTLRFCRSGG